MGQYQTRTVKSTDEEQGFTDISAEEATGTPSGDPPVFGSPIDNESFLATLATLGDVKNTDTILKKTDKLQQMIKAKEEEEDDIEKKKTIPIVFRWESGGIEVYICGSFNNWETKIPMTNSQGDFTAIVDLVEGRHEYKFFVDGQWVHDHNEPSTDNGLGSYNNVVNIDKKHFDGYYETWDLMSPQTGAISPDGSYSQHMPPRCATCGLPPHLPPLLQLTVLNQEPPNSDDPTLLIEPNHVILNHLYALSIKDNVLVLAATHRYQDKYVTTLMYKPVLL